MMSMRLVQAFCISVLVCIQTNPRCDGVMSASVSKPSSKTWYGTGRYARRFRASLTLGEWNTTALPFDKHQPHLLRALPGVRETRRSEKQSFSKVERIFRRGHRTSSTTFSQTGVRSIRRASNIEFSSGHPLNETQKPAWKSGYTCVEAVCCGSPRSFSLPARLRLRRGTDMG